MDLLSLSPSEEPQRMPLVNPDTGEQIYLDDETREKPTALLVYGQDSKAYTKAKHAIAKRQAAHLRVKAGGKLEGLDAALEDENALVIACVAGWENLNLGGNTEFTSERVAHLFEVCPWAAEQVKAFAFDRSNYLGE